MVEYRPNTFGDKIVNKPFVIVISDMLFTKTTYTEKHFHYYGCRPLQRELRDRYLYFLFLPLFDRASI